MSLVHNRLTHVLVLLCMLLGAALPAHAQAPAPGAPPPGVDLALGALAYQANFRDTKAWPALATNAKASFAGDGQGHYRATSADTSAPAWGPSTAFVGRDYYAEMTINLESCGDQGVLYFVVRMTRSTVVEGNNFSYIVQCNGTIMARRVFGGQVQLTNATDSLGGALKPGRHQIGVLSIGTTGRWFVDGREVGRVDSFLMPLMGRVGLGISGNIALSVLQLRIWTLAADAPPAGTGALIYDADFASDKQWPTGLTDSALTRTADQVYLLDTLGTPFAALSGRVQAADVVVRLAFEPRQCQADSSLGLLFRATSTAAYVFALRCDGTYFVGVLNRQQNALDEPLISTGKSRPMEAFADSRSLMVLAKGSTIKLFIDRKQVGTLTVKGATAPGDAGIYAASAPGGAMQAGVQVFSVWSAK
jgi:hypothetical protein